MTYPQPDATDYAIGAYSFFRLNATLTSPGDIYEADQSAHAFAIGPDSDIANAVAVYVDEIEDTATQMNQVAFSANRTMVGEIAVRQDASYGPSKRPGRILLYCNDIFDPNWRPSTFDRDNDEIQFIRPVFDVLQYFKPTTSLGPARVDRRYLFQNFDVSGDHKTWVVLPYYGRRYGAIKIKNVDLIDTHTIEVYGVNFGISPNTVPDLFQFETTIVAPVAVGPQVVHNVILSTQPGTGVTGVGTFDMIAIGCAGGDSIAIHALFSDVIG